MPWLATAKNSQSTKKKMAIGCFYTNQKFLINKKKIIMMATVSCDIWAL
jgi:hypothetical protein